MEDQEKIAGLLLLKKEIEDNISRLRQGIKSLREEQEELKFYLTVPPEKKWKNLGEVSYDKQALENNIARIEVNIERVERSVRNEQESLERMEEAIEILKKQQIARS